MDKQANSKQLVLVETTDHKSKNYFKDSLGRIEIFPSEEFYIRTNEQINKHAPVYAEVDDHYEKYSSRINTWIEDEMNRGMSREEATHYYMDLRVKLKI